MPLADQFKALIAEQLEADPVIVTPNARFVEDLCADSLDIVELTMTCEETFEIEIPDEEAEHLTTVAKAQAYLERRLEQESEVGALAITEREPRSFLQLWKYKQAAFEVELAEPLRHSASSQFGRVQIGDTLWIVAVNPDGVLFLVGRLLVGDVLDDPTAVERFGNDIYEADLHVESKPGAEELPCLVNLMDIAGKLRFESKGGNDRLHLVEGRVDARQLQVLRQLNAESVRLLEHEWHTTETPDAGTIQKALKRGAGFGSPERNRKVEKAAVDFVTRDYEKRGWDVQSVEAKRLGYDLLCTKGRNAEHVEVKGISGKESAFIITSGEVETARIDPHFILCVVASALSRPRLHSYTGAEFLAKFHLQTLAYRASLL